MVIYGRINKFERREMNDGGVIYEARFCDVSKPFALRTNGEFVTYLSEDARKRLPQGEEVFDSEITIVVREIGAGQGGTAKVKGDVLPGIVAIDKLGKSGDIPQRPSASDKK